MAERIIRPLRRPLLLALALLPAACAAPPGAPGLSFHFKTAENALTLVFVNDGDAPRTITGIQCHAQYWSRSVADDGTIHGGVSGSPYSFVKRGGYVVEPGKPLELRVGSFRRVGDHEIARVFVDYTCEGVKYHGRLEIAGRLRTNPE